MFYENYKRSSLLASVGSIKGRENVEKWSVRFSENFPMLDIQSKIFFSFLPNFRTRLI